jgi:hypothetical protein
MFPVLGWLTCRRSKPPRVSPGNIKAAFLWVKEMIEYGYCQCGCGNKTNAAPFNDASKGYTKGEPMRYLKGHCFKAGNRGDKHPRWKGGRSLSTHGYVVVWTPEGRKYEHILVAEKALGRTLNNYGAGNPNTEVVHHINGQKQDNKPENLLICTHSYHTELHHRLEASSDWPEFKKIARNTKEKADERRKSKGI